jgi:hypothetical protein
MPKFILICLFLITGCTKVESGDGLVTDVSFIPAHEEQFHYAIMIGKIPTVQTGYKYIQDSWTIDVVYKDVKTTESYSSNPGVKEGDMVSLDVYKDFLGGYYLRVL